MDTKGKIYIAGPMRGHRAFNFKAFFVAQHYLEAAGWDVVNPAEEDVETMLVHSFKTGEAMSVNPRDLLKRDIGYLSECNAIYLLEGFDDSDGARCEMAYARACGLHLYYQNIVDEQKYAREDEGGRYED